MADSKTAAVAVDPRTALNGAQVTSLRQLLLDAAAKQLPRQTVVEAIAAAFPLTVQDADKIVGEVGSTFFALVEPKGEPQPQAEDQEEAAA